MMKSDELYVNLNQMNKCPELGNGYKTVGLKHH